MTKQMHIFARVVHSTGTAEMVTPSEFTFFLGTHHAAWLEKTDVPLFLSKRCLESRRTLPRARGPWALDSGGFTELSLHGAWQSGPREYASLVRRLVHEVGGLRWAAIQDWMVMMKRETRLRPERGGKFFGPVAGLTPLDAPRSAFGRCFLCKSDVVNRRAYAVCAECDDAQEVRASWAHDYGSIEVQHEQSGNRECFCLGWLWMNEQDDGSFNIERCDTCRTVRDDSDAARDVVVRCCIRGVDWNCF